MGNNEIIAFKYTKVLDSNKSINTNDWETGRLEIQIVLPRAARSMLTEQHGQIPAAVKKKKKYYLHMFLKVKEAAV